MSDDLAMVDPKLNSFDKEEVIRVIHVAFLCTQMDPMSRPSMSQVIAMLNRDMVIGTLPSKPLYLMFWNVDYARSRNNSNDKTGSHIEFQPDQFESS